MDDLIADDRIHALDMPDAEETLTERQRAYLGIAREKIGFVPNVLASYAWHSTKFDAFTRMYNDLMLGGSGLTKLQREMIAVAVSCCNRCYYCLAAHGAAVRDLSGDDALADQLVMNYRAAALDPKDRAMLDAAWSLTERPQGAGERERDALRAAGWSDRDQWDIFAVAAFFNMTNRMSAATDLRPNGEYHRREALVSG